MAQARQLHQSGRLREAESAYRAIIAKNPANLEANLRLASLLRSTGRAARAINMLQSLMRVSSRACNNPDILHELGLAYHQNGQPNKAAQHLENAYRINPDSPQIHKDLGNALHLVGRLDEAVIHLEKALEQMPTDPVVPVYLCELYQSLGRFNDAENIITDRLKETPHPALIFAAAKLCKRKKDNQQALQYLQQIINNQSRIPPQLLASTLFEYAAVLENLGDYDDAFQNYTKANNLLNYKYNPGASKRQVDALINAYTPETIATITRSSVNSDLSIFILGMPRSGTTLIEQIIGSHSLAFGAGELPHLGNTCTTLLNKQNKTSRRTWNPVDFLHASISDLNHAADEYLLNVKPLDPNAKRITDKMPPNFYYIGFIAQLLPHARIIHCKRSPLDTCLSIFATPLGPAHQYSTNLTSLGQYYREYQRLTDHWCSVIDELDIPFTEIQYESVIDHPEDEIRRIIQFCGLEWEDQCLNFHESKRSVATASVDQVRQPIYRSSLNRYEHFKTHLTPLIDALSDIIP